MNQIILGQLLALSTAFCWAISSLSYEQAGKKIGSLNVNLLRLLAAYAFYTIFALIYRGTPWPAGVNLHGWIWLSLSGIVGFFLGDLFLFEAFVRIGARISMLIFALVPPLTALLGFLFLGEILSRSDLAGMFITIIGVAMVILKRGNGKSKFVFKHSVSGILFGFGGALGQSGGLILGKYGMQDYNPFLVSQIRAIAALVCFTLLFFVMRRWRKVLATIGNAAAWRWISLGSFFGPFIGVSVSLFAIRFIPTGVASTITSIVPVILIPPAIIFFKEKVNWLEILGAIIAVLGVALLFLF
ncbi:MAG: DMT family transporter [Candidatus Cloacimonadales bacterium]